MNGHNRAKDVRRTVLVTAAVVLFLGGSALGSPPEKQATKRTTHEPTLPSASRGPSCLLTLLPIGNDSIGSLDPGVTIVGNEMRMDTGGREVFLEVRIGDWDPTDSGVQLRGWQAALDASGYSSGLNGSLTIFNPNCADNAQCVETVGTGSTCIATSDLFVPLGTCAPAYIDFSRNDYVYTDVSALAGVELASANFRWGGAAVTPPSGPDDPEPFTDGGRYAGTLALFVPPGATGTFTVSFDQSGSALNDQSGAFIEPLIVCPAMITIPDCDQDGTSDFDEIAAGEPDVDGNGVPDVCERLFVDADATGANDGSSWTDAFNFLQNALADAEMRNVDGDPTNDVNEIWVAAGTYKPDQGVGITPGDRSATFQLLNGVALFGGFAGGETALDQRDIAVNETILSADLAGDDTPVACTQNAPDCDAFGRLCDAGACILKQNMAENSYHVVTGSATDATAILDGFTITGGNANGTFPAERGGGMFNETGSPTVMNCTFSGNASVAAIGTGGGGGMYNANDSSPTVIDCMFNGNTAAFAGGGMFNLRSSPTVANCTFSGNSAFAGGGMRNNDFSNPAVTNCTFSKNSAILAGAMANDRFSSPTLRFCTFVDNTAESLGGAVDNFNSSPNIWNCRFFGNVAITGDGGAMSNDGEPPPGFDSNPTLVNCLFSGNTALSFGGAVWSNDGTTTMRNCTLGRNNAATGGGLYIDGGSTLQLVNAVLYANADGGGLDESAQIHVADGTPIVDYSIIQGLTGALGGTGNIGLDPLFADLDGADNLPGTEDDDLRLRAGSPAIDAGDTTALPLDEFDLDGDGDTTELLPIDLAGRPRVRDDIFTLNTGIPFGGGVVDMGAFELYLDCNDNGTLDDDEIAGDASLDCNGNGLLDVCEIDENSVAPGGPFFCIVDCDPDCNGNGVPDACDIAACGVDVPFDPSCDDCNLNGVPDFCDDPVDSIPDECVEAVVGGTDNWSDGTNWPLAGDFPDNTAGVPDLNVTLGLDDNLLVDVDITIDTLRLQEGATLRVTQTGAGDFTVIGPGGIQSEGDIQVDLDRAVDASAGSFTLRGAGTYGPAPLRAAGTVSASLTAGAITLLPDSGPFQMQQLTLTDGMTLSSQGDFVLDGSGSCDCPLNTSPDCPPRRTTGINVLRRGGRTLPILLIKDVFLAGLPADTFTINVDGDFIVDCAAEVCVGCQDVFGAAQPTMRLSGNFINRSVVPSLFRWTNGRLLFDVGDHTFEAAGLDFGPRAEGFNTTAPTLFEPGGPHTNFSMDTIELAAGVNAAIINGEINTAGIDACDEALYVSDLVLGDNATLTVTNTHVYYETLTEGVDSAIVTEGCGTVCEAFELAAPQSDLTPKNRFVSFATGNPGRTTAVEVTFVDLPAPFDGWNGATLWVGQPMDVCNLGGLVDPSCAETIPVAELQCDGPVFFDWSSIGTVHVFHEGIVPNGVYRFREIECPDLTFEPNYSPALELVAAKWGDTVTNLSMVPPGPPDGVVTILDVLAILGRFVSDQTSITKARADLEPGCLDLVINISDVLFALTGFQGLPYPFTPTAPTPCDSTCASPLP